MDANVLDVYRMSPEKSILNNVFRSMVLRRPVYATSTDNSVTQVWRIEAHGALVRIAVVNWLARRVVVGEVEQALEDAVVKPKGFFQRRGSRIISFGSTQFKLQAIIGDQWHEAWRCTMLKAPGTKGKTNNENASYNAEFTPPQPYIKASDLRLYRASPPATRSGSRNGAGQLDPFTGETIDNLIVSCILVAAGRNEYKTLQSSSRPSTGDARTRHSGASLLRSNSKHSLPGRPLPTLSFCVEGTYVPHHLMEIQRQLYALNVVAGSAATLPPYQSV